MFKLLLKSAPSSPVRNLDRVLIDPVVSQAQLLRGLLREARNTVWGREHRYSELTRSDHTVRDFQSSISLNDYDSLQPFITRAPRTGSLCVIILPKETVRGAVGASDSAAYRG